MDSNANQIYTSMIQLSRWVTQEQHKGWDPYDGTTAERFKNNKTHTITKQFMRQFNLYSPVNLRPAFGIQKDTSNKALALFSRSYLLLSRLTRDRSYAQEAKKLLTSLAGKKIDTYGCAWSDYFDYEYGQPQIPDIVVTSEAIKSYSMAYEFFKDIQYFNIAKSALQFIISHLYVKSDAEVYMKYTPGPENRIVLNASALMLGVLSEYLKFDSSSDLDAIGNNIIEFLNSHQNKEGYWPYSYYPSTHYIYKQLDYHQGFILDGLYSFLPYLQEKQKEKTMVTIQRGMQFYMKKQFALDGSSYYRYPLRYPVDIHNQAQGILTFSKLSDINSEYLQFAKKIAVWTIEHMQNKSGFFYHHKFPVLINKIPYMRWGQAWMMLALSEYLSCLKKTESTIDES